MTRVAARRLVTPSGVLEPGWLEVDGQRVTRVVAGRADEPAPTSVPILIPGLVDVHVHGGGGAAFTDGTTEGVHTAMMHHRRRGSTTVCASLMTAALPDLERQVSRMAGFVDDGLLAGIHLEGPWLSPRRAGAHSPELLRPPDRAEVLNLLRLGRGTVRMVTLAPELEGGIEAVRVVVDHGAVASLGHTDAEYQVATAALDAGATQATHLGNGMRPMHHREPGVVLALLERENVVLELINDGVHLHDMVTSAVIRLSGVHRVALVSDSIAAGGLPDTTYQVAGDEVMVSGREVRNARTGSFAGSAISLVDALRRAVRILGVPLSDAVAMASSTPARALGLADRGRLEAGAFADLVVLDDDLRVSSVMYRGAWLANSSSLTPFTPR